MEDKLREIVARIAETEPNFAPDASLRDDLHLDSVRALELIFEIQKDLGIKVPDGEMAGVRTFGDLASLVASAVGSASIKA